MPGHIIRQPAAFSGAARAGLLAAAVASCGIRGLAGCSLLIDVPPKKDPVSSPDASSNVPPSGPDGAADRAVPASPRDSSVDADPDAPAGDAEAVQDAAPPSKPVADAPFDAPCTGEVVAWYPDDDRDGYGRSSNSAEIRLSCAPPGPAWSRVAGDCADDNALVFPAQVTYFGTPYRRADGSDSFDYDCSNFEEGDPTIPISPKNCGLLSLALCGGMGYAATAREALGLNPYCGSEVWSTCEAKGLGILVCEATTVRRDPPYGCR